MGNKVQKQNWQRRVTQGLAGAVVVTSAGCGFKTPEESLRQTVYEAAAECDKAPRPASTNGMKRNNTLTGSVHASVSCEIAKDGTRLDSEITRMGNLCAKVEPGKTKIHFGADNDLIVSCTRAMPQKNPLMTVFAPAPAASAPASAASGARKREEQKRNAASAAAER